MTANSRCSDLGVF